jgi:hypothetical protein
VGTVGDRYQLYLNGDRQVTILATGWESTADADEFDQAMRRRLPGKRSYLVGANYILMLGDYGDKADDLAFKAMEGASFWPRDESVGKWPPEKGPEVWLGYD